MSQGNAAAIRRRVRNAEGQSTPTFDPSNINNDTSTNSTGSSNVIPVSDAFKMVNTRLFDLEQKIESSSSIDKNNSDLSSILDEYNARFDIIATELGELKETILKLQTFTMDVNKTLFDERIQVLGEIKKEDIEKDTVVNLENTQINEEN